MNPHVPCGTADFESAASASFATPALARIIQKKEFLSTPPVEFIKNRRGDFSKHNNGRGEHEIGISLLGRPRS